MGALLGASRAHGRRDAHDGSPAPNQSSEGLTAPLALSTAQRVRGIAMVDRPDVWYASRELPRVLRAGA